MTKDPKRRGPSIELQRQIDESIASRNRTSRGGDFVSTSTASGIVVATPKAEAGVPPPDAQFEYLDHPADVILHSWGNDFPHALSNLALCMFGYMTSLDTIIINDAHSSDHGLDITAQGHDMHSLIFSFLDEWLFNFHDTGFIPKEVTIKNYSRDVWRISSTGKGEIMDIKRHPQGTEVKAITYSGMRVEERNDGRFDIFVVVDI